MFNVKLTPKPIPSTSSKTIGNAPVCCGLAPVALSDGGLLTLDTEWRARNSLSRPPANIDSTDIATDRVGAHPQQC